MRISFTILLSLALCAGCSSGTPIVEGIATLDSQPIDGGEIKLIPQPGTSGTEVGGTITAGKYKLSGRASPATGKHRVEVRWVRKTGRQVPIPTDPKGPGRMDEIDETVPAQYNAKSELEIDVKPGINPLNLSLSTTIKEPRTKVAEPSDVP